jgi:hypothetical protein
MVTSILSLAALGDMTKNRTNPICVAPHKCNKVNQGKNACGSHMQQSPLFFPWLPWVTQHKIEPIFCVAPHKCNKENQGKSAFNSYMQWSPLYFPSLPWAMHHKIEPILFVLQITSATRQIKVKMPVIAPHNGHLCTFLGCLQ